jgi:hypothetical protein
MTLFKLVYGKFIVGKLQGVMSYSLVHRYRRSLPLHYKKRQQVPRERYYISARKHRIIFQSTVTLKSSSEDGGDVILFKMVQLSLLTP